MPAAHSAHLFFIHSPTSSPNLFLDQMVCSNAYVQIAICATCSRRRAMKFITAKLGAAMSRLTGAVDLPKRLFNSSEDKADVTSGGLLVRLEAVSSPEAVAQALAEGPQFEACWFTQIRSLDSSFGRFQIG